MIGFNKPFLSGKETEYITDSVSTKKISGNGKYTKMCHHFFKSRYGFDNCLLTTSCTDALEMAAILLDIKSGDEVIMPAYTFVSTSNAFVLRGAKIVFADSSKDNPNIDLENIESLINSKTKAIIVVHYGGYACDMEKLLALKEKYNLFLVEDAAQAIDNYYIFKDGTKKALGSFGDLASFSFHETKNIIAGEGGLLVVNNPDFAARAEIIWEKGTNRSAFFRGEVDKYGWVDIGSSFLPSDIIAAFLYAQLENIDRIQEKRVANWNRYYQGLEELQLAGKLRLPNIPAFSTNNAHVFYIVTKNLEERTALIDFLKEKEINAVFHYLSLHSSPFYADKHDGRTLIHSDHFSDTLVRLPLYFELSFENVDYIVSSIKEFYA
jgi:dTDP-4-amino-4,6-dideoxygalactose transaminase